MSALKSVFVSLDSEKVLGLRFLPGNAAPDNRVGAERQQANCCAKQNVFAGSESIYHFRQLGQDRPESLAYFDTDCIEKALLGQDYDALRSDANADDV